MMGVECSCFLGVERSVGEWSRSHLRPEAVPFLEARQQEPDAGKRQHSIMQVEETVMPSRFPTFVWTQAPRSDRSRSKQHPCVDLWTN